jgi:site-specific DNA-methyltransferase (adenine-specific)
VWDKQNGTNNMADAELAWASFATSVRMYRGHIFKGIGNTNYTTIHPTQKPIKLYKWILKNYAKAGNTILDTHLGSGSSRIACHDMGFEFTGYEIDKDYFDAQEKRFNNHILQQSLFTSKDMYE